MVVSAIRVKNLPPKKAFPKAMMTTSVSQDVNAVVVECDDWSESNEAGNNHKGTSPMSPKLDKKSKESSWNHVVYRDFSHVKPDEGAIQMAANKEPTFIVKLHQMLSNPDIADIITWLPHGRAWRILQRKAFEDRVVPLYFRHCRYSSFMRQVNGWGFRRVTNGSDYNSYYHEMFLRGMPHLCYKMRRLTTKDGGSRGRHPKEVEDEPSPNFYRLTEEHPLPESIPVPKPTPPPQFNTVSGGAVHGQLPFSGSQAIVSDLPSSHKFAASSHALVSTGLQTAQIHPKANGKLGIMAAALHPDLGLGLAQSLYPQLSLNTHASFYGLPSASVGAGLDPLISGQSVGLQQMIEIERQKAAAAEMARITAMDNLLRLRQAGGDKSAP